jgi:putative oxidoreductase
LVLLGRKNRGAAGIFGLLRRGNWRTPMGLIDVLEKGRALAERIPYSLIALLARLAVATVFWRSGQTKVEGFFVLKENTFFLFAEEYKVPLLPPDLAAYLATISEHVFPVLLVLGLASRLSALALLIMTAVIQIFVYPDGWPGHILWAACLLLILARGPGAISLDHLIWNRVQPATAPATR